jgi:hypothetical protein
MRHQLRRMSNWLLQHFVLYKTLELSRNSTRSIAAIMKDAHYSFARGKTKVWNAMRKMHITSSFTIKRPCLTRAQMQCRVEFAERMSHDFLLNLP